MKGKQHEAKELGKIGCLEYVHDGYKVSLTSERDLWHYTCACRSGDKEF